MLGDPRSCEVIPTLGNLRGDQQRKQKLGGSTSSAFACQVLKSWTMRAVEMPSAYGGLFGSVGPTCMSGIWTSLCQDRTHPSAYFLHDCRLVQAATGNTEWLFQHADSIAQPMDLFT